MKPAKLPGVEKFKFWDKSLLEEDDDEDDESISSLNDNDSVDSGGSGPKVKKKLTSKSVSPGGGSGDSIDGLGQGDTDQSVFIRGYLIRNTCSSLPTPKKSILCDTDSETESTEHHSLPVYHTCHPSSCHLVHHHHHHHPHHYHHRRKVILPISSRLAAKVLTSTDLPLDLFDIRDHYKSTRLRNVVLTTATVTPTTNTTSTIPNTISSPIAGGELGGDESDDKASAGRTTLQPKRFINLNNNTTTTINNNEIFIHKDTDDDCT